METNQSDPPYGVRGQLNNRFEQHTIGYLRPSPVRSWFHKLAGYREPVDEILARQQAKRERSEAGGDQ